MDYAGIGCEMAVNGREMAGLDNASGEWDWQGAG